MKTSKKHIFLKFLLGFDTANLIFIRTNELEKLVLSKHYWSMVFHHAIFNMEVVPIK